MELVLTAFIYSEVFLVQICKGCASPGGHKINLKGHEMIHWKENKKN